ncbi:MerR family transcriptional regulator [Nocardia sp. AG03]|uniref:DNA polymerase III subunit beta family protein n=1 Tax=Nocardia sp. AG03 TaxID=3025312 RepID=UPI002418246C|nr:MerR family transcriptional regulator [Nocardia sp. AG03]
MPESELITIGAFARLCGLSASALRFYADAGVLVPAVVDEATGYRYYTPDQATTAAVIRRLRAVDMPLPGVTALLTEPDPHRATELLDAHLTALDHHLTTLRTAAEAARAATAAYTGSAQLDGADEVERPGGAAAAAGARAQDAVRVRGPVLAAAIDQVATATVSDPRHPVLDSIHFAADGDDLVLTATDRYRLATRTVRVAGASSVSWAATVDAADLRSTVSWLRRQHTVTLRPDTAHLRFTAADGERDAVRANGIGAEPDRLCRYGAEDFPDHRAMLEALPEVRVRVVLDRAALLTALESVHAATVTLRLSPGQLRLTDESIDRTLTAAVTGPAMTIHFAVTTLYPAVAGAIGPDLMLDLIAPDQPVRIRSADDGTLLTLAMPRRPESSGPTTP